MATRLRERSAELYERDFYVWAQEQARLLRERRFGELDLEHLVEEVEDLADALFRSACSRAATIMAHLLKLQYSPAKDPRYGWRHTVRVQRSDLVIRTTPKILEKLPGELPRLYELARAQAEGDLCDYGERAAADAMPAACLYTLDQITGDWWPPEAGS